MSNTVITLCFSAVVCDAKVNSTWANFDFCQNDFGTGRSRNWPKSNCPKSSDAKCGVRVAGRHTTRSAKHLSNLLRSMVQQSHGDATPVAEARGLRRRASLKYV